MNNSINNRLRGEIRNPNSKIRKIDEFLFNCFMLIVGNALYALAVELIVIPSNLVTAGVTGIAVLISHYIPVEVSVIVFILNVALFILGAAVLGKHFFVTTLASTLLYPLFLFIFEHTLRNKNFLAGILDDNVLCVIVAGLIMGVSLGMVIRIGASTGGMDIPPLVAHKLLGTPVGAGMLVVDAITIFVQLIDYSLKSVLYGVIVVIIYSAVIDKVTVMGTSTIQLNIVSDHADEIRKAILTELGRGVTLISSTRGLSGEKGNMVMSVIYKLQIPRAKKIILAIDPSAFIVITHVSEVNGNGFSFIKEDKKLRKTDIS